MSSQRTVTMGGVAALCLLAACGDPTGPAVGALEVSANVTGSDVDVDGFTVTVGSRVRSLGVVGSVIFTDLEVGPHAVELSDVAPNCTADPVLKTVQVLENDTIPATFDISCAARVGAIEVTIATTGQDIPPHGYRLLVNGDTSRVPPDTTILIEELREGDVRLELVGVPGPCSVEGENPRVATVPFDDRAVVKFDVACRLGLLAFSSDRDGGMAIYVLDPSGGEATRAVTGGAFDVYPTWSPNGDRIAFYSSRSGNNEIYSVGTDGGGLVNLTRHSSDDVTPSWTRDGRILFASRRDGNPEIYSMKGDGSDPVRLTHHDATDGYPAASPDGAAIAFSSNRESGVYQIYVLEGGATRQLTTGTRHKFFPAWSPDGTRILFTSEADGKGDIYVIDADGSNTTQLTTHGADDTTPAWSAGGTRIAFASNRDGDYEIYLMNPDGTGLVKLTNNNGFDAFPAWP